MAIRTKRTTPGNTPASLAPAQFMPDPALFSTNADRTSSQPAHASQPTEAVEGAEQVSAAQPVAFGHQFGSVAIAAPQAKLAVSQTGDPLEEEADRVADEVLSLEEFEGKRDGSSHPVKPPAAGRSGLSGLPSDMQSLVTSATGSGGAPLSAAARHYMQPRFGHDFSQVRVHTDAAASDSARALNAHAYTVGHDVVFAPGKYAPGTSDGDRLLAHELTHVVQQTADGDARGTAIASLDGSVDASVSGPSATVQRKPAPEADPSTLDQLRKAEDDAAKQDTLSPAAGGMTNIGDVTTAKAAIEKVKLATNTLEMGDAGDWVGDKGEPKHKAANAEVEQLLGFYVGSSGEETRTGVDFMDRYKKAHSQFARLQGLAQQYEQLTGVSAASSKGVLDMEAASKSADEARKKFDSEKAKLSPEKAADITAAQGNLTQTEAEVAKCKTVMDESATKGRTGFRDLTNATAKISQAAEKEKAEDKKAAVETVKSQIAEMQKWIVGGLELAATVATAGAGAAAGAAGTSPAAMGQAAVGAMQESGTAEVKKLGKEKALSLVKQAGEDIAGTIAAEHYKLELARAEGALAVANKLADGYGKEIGANEARTAADNWAQGIRTLHAQSVEFDRLQKVMRDQIRDLGRAIGAAGIGKEDGARYEVVAEFRAETTAFVNEADAAIGLGKQAQAALKEGGERRGQAAYDKDQSRVYYDAYRWHDGRWKLRMNYVNLGVRQTAGEGGMTEKIDTLVAELEQYRASAEQYRQVVASAMGASV